VNSGGRRKLEVARYGQNYKDRVVARLLPPESSAVDEVSRQVGISVAMLERWRAEALADASGERSGSGSQRWTAAARLEAVVATATMDAASRSPGAVSTGCNPAELDAWKQDAIAGLGEPRAASAAEVRLDRRRVKELERELHRKDKALAETAALLVLSKNLGGLPHGRGRMTRLEDRQTLVRDIAQARAAGARLAS
jgi:transposase-like protein